MQVMSPDHMSGNAEKIYLPMEPLLTNKLKVIVINLFSTVSACES